MRYIIPIILTMIVLLIVACNSISQVTIGDLPKLTEVASIDGIVQAFVEAEGTHALAIGIYRDGEMHYHNYGTISEEQPKAPDSLSMFEIGSISKTFTAAVLAAMVEEGKVEFDDPIGKYLPEGLGNWEGDLAITLVELATHKSGMPRLPSNFGWKAIMNMSNPYSTYTVEDLYKFLKKYKPTPIEERETAYSNLGMGLLGHILALVNESDYETLILQYIATPLDMERTTITLDDWGETHWATGHNEYGDPTSNWDLPTLAGAGAIRSNTQDMLKYVAANIHNKLAFEQTHQIREAFSEEAKIGLAWIQSESKVGETVTWHNGGTGGFRTYTGFVKEKDLGVVVLSNTAVSVDEIGFLILDYLAQE